MRKIFSPASLDLQDLKGNELKSLVQKDVNTKFNNINDLVCEITTGFGKTMIAILAIKARLQQNIHIVVPTETLQKQWRKTLDSHSIITNNVEIYIINSYTMTNKVSTNPDLLIVDEAHRCLNKDSIHFSTLISLCPNSKKLLLSASLDDNKKKFLDEHNITNYYVVTRNWAFRNGLVPYHTAMNVPIDLTNQEMSDYLAFNDTISKESKFCGVGRIYDPFKASPDQVHLCATIRSVDPGVVFGKLKRWKAAITGRRNLLYNAANKKDLILELLKYIDEKTLIFCKTINAAKSIAGDDPRGIAYHSELKDSKKNNERQQVLDEFESGRKLHLVSVDILKEGYDIVDCRVIFRLAYTAEEKDTIQITGRASRFDETNLDKESFLFNFYVRSFMARGEEVFSQELKWLLDNQKSEYNVIWFDNTEDVINFCKETFSK